MINIQNIKNDDNSLISGMNNLMLRTIEEYLPEEIYIIRIKNWFDHKWLGYADGAIAPKDDFNITKHLPNFSPGRRLNEDIFYRGENNQYLPYENIGTNWCYAYKSMLFFWVSTESELINRASFMCYSINEKNLNAWFVSFVCDDRWKVSFTKGTDKNTVQNWFYIK